MTLKIQDPYHFATVLEWAVANKCHDKLIEKLDYLGNYSDEATTCWLYSDFALNSFKFVMERADGMRWFSGGLIYSGPTQPLDGSAPALTVGIDIDSSVHGWSVHT